MNTRTSFSYFYKSSTNEWVPLAGTAATSDGISPPTNLLGAAAFNLGWNGTSWDRVRVANVFRAARRQLGATTAIWTPAVGKKFRLMGFTVSVAGTVDPGSLLPMQIVLLDNATVIWRGVAAVSDSTLAGDTQMGGDFGQGYLSSAANQSLNVQLLDDEDDPLDFTSGEACITTWGTEE